MAKATARARDEAAIRTLLSAHGLRVTRPRLAVLRQLHRLRRPVSHTELCEELDEEGLDRITVYRNLIALSDAGIVVKIHLGDQAHRFALLDPAKPEHKDHPHFVCVDCGTIRCLPVTSVALHLDASRRAVVTEVQLKGHCLECST